MPRTNTLPAALLWGAIGLGTTAPLAGAEKPAPTQQTTVPAAEARPDLVVLQALLANPVTAPYRIATAYRGGQVVLAGRVGTKQIHDTAVRVAIATGYSIRDDLTIDTAETYRVAASAGSGVGVGPAMAPGLGTIGGSGSPPYYVYPPPLFGRLDDPFFGFEPPILSYPPWWRAMASRVPLNLPAPAPGAAGTPAPGAPQTTSLQGGAVEMTLDARGVATLRGTVPSLADRLAIGQRIAQTPGVAEVINLLNVGRPPWDVPPPPPTPAFGPGVKPPAAPRPAPDVDEALRPSIAVDRPELAGRLSQSLNRQPALAALPIKVSVRDGIAYLSGTVPTIYEAMLAFRAAQQTPGVREVDDRLEFVVPDGEKKNPLLQKGRPDDVEPYFAAQLRKHLGDIAHVDQVRVRGDVVEIRGTLARDEDRPRLDAILQSMPVLRGFRLEPTFVHE
jgi:osmotically-inducible protein OsmY